MNAAQQATEELILSTPRSQPPTPPNPGVRPSYRDMQISALAQRLYAAYNRSELHAVEFQLSGQHWTVIDMWKRVAEAAVDELIDRPEREFQAQLDAILASDGPTVKRVDAWTPATAEGWL